VSADSSQDGEQVRGAELAAALCLATDLGMGFPFEHGLHSTLIAMRIADRIERPAGLTQREVEVIRMLARGLQTKQVARALGISAKTADRHIQNAYRKIGVSTRAAATLFAMEHGLMAWGELPISRPDVRP
jgi:DNA-binding NarL/FixJ family response regulator